MLKIMKENKKKAISLIIGLLLIFGGIVYIAVSNSDAKEDNNIKVSANSIKELRKDKQDAKVELEKAKESGNKAEIAKAEKKLETIEKKEEASSIASSGKSSKTPNAASKPSSSSASGTSKPAPKPNEKQRVWIVDKAAWVETVQEPIYSERTVFRATTWDNSKSATFYSENECHNWLNTVGEGMGSYQIDTEKYISGYNTKITNHPEQGHWEYR